MRFKATAFKSAVLLWCMLQLVLSFSQSTHMIAHTRKLARSNSIVPLIFIALLVAISPARATDSLPELIRQRLESPYIPYAETEPLFNAKLMLGVYEENGFTPIWVNGRNGIQKAYALYRTVGAATEHAMDPENYHLSLVGGMLADLSDSTVPSRLVDLELALSDMYLSFATHSLRGRINPNSIDPEWFSSPRDQSLANMLASIGDESDVGAQLRSLQPSQPGYLRLKEALAHHREIAANGGWPKVPVGATLKPGMTDPRVAAVRTRLNLPETAEQDTALYDEQLQAAVKDFQRLHGLEPDAIIGKDTLAMLNLNASQKARTIEVNMERWRWLPQTLGDRHIRVNIAGFDLEAWQDGKVVSSQAVVVGRDYRRTPVFSGNMTYLVLNPSWEVPPSIAKKDLLPQIQQDPSYLSRMNFQVLEGWGSAEKKLDPAQIPWASLTQSTMNYRFRQGPGPFNALGKVKLMFPNPHAIYLHDTPARNLFAKAERGFSSGCIRLEQPLELSAWALEGTTGWDRTRIDAQVSTGITETVKLKRPVQVHLLYWTTWVNENGDVHFRRDIYGRDALLNAALALPPPRAN